MTAQQLKNAILQMAVQGKLVPQDPNDEPASVLLERIKAEKQALIKAGKLKKDKKSSEIFRGASRNLPYAFCEQIGKEIRDISDEIPFEIPESWEWVHLEHIAISDLGKTLDKAKNTGNFQPYLCSINVYWNGIDLSKVKEARFEDSELPKYLLKKGDLLICEGGEVGRCCVWDKDISMYYQNALHRVRFYGNINPYYFKCLMELYKGIGIIEAHSKGVTIKHLVQKSLNSIYFPLPPLAAQHRIVAKIEELLPYIDRYDKAENQLTALNTTFPEALKKSILQEAVQGKLVLQNPDDEPASVLLERIRAEKQALIKAGKIKRDKHESVIITRDKIPYEIINGKERCIADEVPFELPESWEWAYLSTILSKLTDGSHNPPPNTGTGYPVISAKNIKGGKIAFDNVDRFTDEVGFIKENARTNIQENDVLMGIIGGSIGNIAIYNHSEKVIAQRSIAILRFMIDIEYGIAVLKSPLVQNKLQLEAAGSAQGGVYLGTISKILIPVPPLSEQKRIVAKIEELMQYCNEL